MSKTIFQIIVKKELFEKRSKQGENKINFKQFSPTADAFKVVSCLLSAARPMSMMSRVPDSVPPEKGGIAVVFLFLYYYLLVENVIFILIEVVNQ